MDVLGQAPNHQALWRWPFCVSFPGKSCHLSMATPSRGCLSSALPPIKVMLELLVVTIQSADRASTVPGGKRERGFILRIDVLIHTVELSSH